MDDCSYIGFVNANTKCGGGNHNIKIVVFPSSQNYVSIRFFRFTRESWNVFIACLTQLFL